MSRVVDVPSLLAALKIPVVRQAGTAVWCCCPIHLERTPSWFIRDDPGDRFHGSSRCYGCKGGWFPVQLVQAMLGLKTQKEAYEWLRTMPTVEQPLPQRVEVVSRVSSPRLVVPREVRFDDWPDRYREYLTERRHMPWDQVMRWELGYVDRESPSELADRLFIPARDSQGTLLSYTCRAVGNARRRYREPRREEGASGAAVFGELLWPALPKGDVVVVEGAFNALAVERASPKPVAFAALMGSSLHPLQVMKLSRFPHVILATDPDSAGEKAAIALEGALARYCKVSRIRIPVGEDCDSMPEAQLRDLLGRALEPCSAPTVSST